MDDGRTPPDGCRLDGYTISSPREPNGSGELIMDGQYRNHGTWEIQKFTLAITRILYEPRRENVVVYAADLCLCFRICKKQAFSLRGLQAYWVQKEGSVPRGAGSHREQMFSICT